MKDNAFSATVNVVQTKQEVNPYTLEKVCNYFGKPGVDMLHEVTESYKGGKITQQTGISATGTNTEHDAAHALATPPSGIPAARLVDSNGNQTTNRSNYDHIEIYMKTPGKSEQILRIITKQNP